VTAEIARVEDSIIFDTNLLISTALHFAQFKVAKCSSPSNSFSCFRDEDLAIGISETLLSDFLAVDFSCLHP
jgi:hypothetical protein